MKSSLGKVLLKTFKSRNVKVTLFGQRIPLEDLVTRDSLPLLMILAARKDFIDMEKMYDEEFINYLEPHSYVFLSGFIVSSDPDPAIWAMPIVSAITTLPRCKYTEYVENESNKDELIPSSKEKICYKLDEAIQDWNEAVMGVFGPLNLNFKELEVPENSSLNF